MMKKTKKYLDKYRSLPLAVKAAFWFVVCSAVQNGAKFLSMPILVRLLRPDEYGIYSVFLSWTNIVAIFATLKMETEVYNNAMFSFSDAKDEYTSSAQSISVTGVTLFLILYLLFPTFWSNIFGLPPEIAVMIFVQLLFTEGFLMWTSRQRYEYKYINLVISTAAYSLAYLIVPATAGALAEESIRLTVIVYAGAAVQAAFGLGFTVYNYIKGRLFFRKEYWRFAIGFNLPLIPHFLSSIILGESDRVMIKNIAGSSEAGIYSFTYTVSIIINIVTSAINNALIPQTYKALKGRNFKTVRSASNALLVSVGALILMFSAVAPEFIKLFATEEYYDAIRLVPVISLSSFFGFLYCIFANVEFFFEANRLVAAASVIGAAANVALNALLIPIFGYYAAGYTTFVCYVLYSLIHYIFMKIVCRKKMNGAEVYDHRTILIISLAVVAAAFGMLLVYDCWFIRYALFAAGLITAFIKRKTIVGMLIAVKGEKS